MQSFLFLAVCKWHPTLSHCHSPGTQHENEKITEPRQRGTGEMWFSSEDNSGTEADLAAAGRIPAPEPQSRLLCPPQHSRNPNPTLGIYRQGGKKAKGTFPAGKIMPLSPNSGDAGAGIVPRRSWHCPDETPGTASAKEPTATFPKRCLQVPAL